MIITILSFSMFTKLGIKFTMTGFAERYLIAQVILVFSAYICPIKKAFLTFGEFIKSAMFTMFSASKIASYPLMNSSITNLITSIFTARPKIMIRFPIVFTVAFFRTILTTSILQTRSLKLKSLIACLALLTKFGITTLKATFLRAINFDQFSFVSLLQSRWRDKELNFTYGTFGLFHMQYNNINKTY